MQNRLYFSSDDVAQALIDAGFDLRPEDCSTIKFWHVAEILGGKARKHVRRELATFAENVLQPTPGHRKIPFTETVQGAE